MPSRAGGLRGVAEEPPHLPFAEPTGETETMSRDRSAALLPCLVAIALLASTAVLPSSASAAEPDAPMSSTLHWHPLGEEHVLADREGKPILYFFTADWCAPCHRLKETLFSDPEKASRISRSFVPVEVQDTRVEKGENLPEVDEVLQRYLVSTIPTLVVALPDGSEVGQYRGYAGAARTWSWLERQATAAEDRLGDR